VAETLERPTSLVDVTGLSTLIEERENGSLLIGAGVRNTAVAGHPLAALRGQVATAAAFRAAAEAELTTQTQVAAERLGLPRGCVSLRYGDSTLAGQFLAGGSSQTASIGAAVRAAHRELVTELLKLADAASPLEIMHWSMHSFGAMFAEVRVNGVTGETRVSRFLGSFDCGTGTGAAIATAVYNACGKRVRKLPITLDKLLAM
jgi:xanthine dehydrogenase YagR molybdenum-binding subunit